MHTERVDCEWSCTCHPLVQFIARIFTSMHGMFITICIAARVPRCSGCVLVANIVTSFEYAAAEEIKTKILNDPLFQLHVGGAKLEKEMRMPVKALAISTLMDSRTHATSGQMSVR